MAGNKVGLYLFYCLMIERRKSWACFYLLEFLSIQKWYGPSFTIQFDSKLDTLIWKLPGKFTLNTRKNKFQENLKLRHDSLNRGGKPVTQRYIFVTHTRVEI
jgi:hypothetical protein